MMIVFPTMTEVMTTFGRLTGPPQVLDLPIDEEGLRHGSHDRQSSNPLQAARAWAQQYQERRRKQKKK